nr:OmpA family protein [Agrobacterium pusense]
MFCSTLTNPTFDQTLKPHSPNCPEVLITMHDSRVEITGHTDSKGSDEYDDKLSIRRANSVKAWLKENGVISKMTTAGKGERSPVAPNQTASGADDPNGWQKNRRVEFVIGGN